MLFRGRQAVLSNKCIPFSSFKSIEVSYDFKGIFC